MKRLAITMALALCAGVLATAAPAAVWTCTATNARLATYFGNGVIKANAEARALAKCRLDSAAPRTCHIVNCTVP